MLPDLVRLRSQKMPKTAKSQEAKMLSQGRGRRKNGPAGG